MTSVTPCQSGLCRQGTKHLLIFDVHPGTVDTAHMLIELIFIRDDSLHVNLPSIKDAEQFLISHISST